MKWKYEPKINGNIVMLFRYWHCYKGKLLSTSIEYVHFLVYINSTEKRTNQFSVEYIINPTLHVNKMFREKVDKWLRGKIHKITMSGIKMLWEKKYAHWIGHSKLKTLIYNIFKRKK